MAKTKAPGVCEGCAKWDKFKEECWVYWDNKKICTLHSDNVDNFIF